MKPVMKSQTVEHLLELNRQFYQTFGEEFSATRRQVQTGVLKVLDSLSGNESILDLGCGNGSLARELRRRNHKGDYIGIDSSLPLLEIAKKGLEPRQFTFIQADLVREDWHAKLGDAQTRHIDLTAAFAVLHHIPGRETRCNLMKMVHSLLYKGGRFVHSEWQYLDSSRLAKRIQPWEQEGLTTKDIEPGDALLDWRSGGKGLRYVHLFDEEEMERLAQASGFRVLQTFHSDGENQRLGLYQLWEAVSS